MSRLFVLGLAAGLCAVLTLVLGLLAAVVFPNLGASMVFEQHLSAIAIVPTVGTIMVVLLVAAWWSLKATRKFGAPLIRVFHEPPQKRSFWRAIGAALVTETLLLVLFLLVYWLLRPFVWTAVYGASYMPPPGAAFTWKRRVAHLGSAGLRLINGGWRDGTQLVPSSRSYPAAIPRWTIRVVTSRLAVRRHIPIRNGICLEPTSCNARPRWTCTWCCYV